MATSPRRRANPDVAAAVAKLSSILRSEAMSKWAAGDQIAVLVKRHGFRVSELAEQFGRRRNTLSAYYRTSLAFGRGQRDYSVCWNVYDNARRVANRFSLDRAVCLRHIREQGLTQRRDVTAYFADKKRCEAAAYAARSIAQQHAGLIDRCHHADCRLIAQQIPESSIKLAIMDLPYGEYAGGYRPGRDDRQAVARSASDNSDPDAAIALMQDLLRILPAKMERGAAALVFRPGGIDPLYSVLISAAEDHGWDLRYRVTWAKRRAKLGSPNAPYAPSAEAIYVLCPSGDELTNHDGSERTDIIASPAASYRAADAGDYHIYSKPPDLCRRLISKHSYPGELVLDACGCSGNFSIAAIDTGRHFVYCETNDENFAWGSSRVAEAIAGSAAAAM